MKYKIETNNADCIVVKGREKKNHWEECARINEESRRVFSKGISPEQKKEIDRFLRRRGIKVNSQGYAHQ